MNYLSVFAFLAGVAITTQASLHAQLGILLKNPLLAACVAFSSSILFTLLAVVISTKDYPAWGVLKSVPVYLWFSGGVLSAAAISMFYYLIPKMGMGQMMSFALTGQLLAAVIAGHFGWFELPIKPLSLGKMLGVVALVIGVILINKK